MAQGPNVRRLVIRKMSFNIIPPGGGFADGLNVLTNKDKLVDAARAATKWVEQALAAVKSAPDNPFGDDDEAIAEEILRRLEKKS